MEPRHDRSRRAAVSILTDYDPNRVFSTPFLDPLPG